MVTIAIYLTCIICGGGGNGWRGGRTPWGGGGANDWLGGPPWKREGIDIGFPIGGKRGAGAIGTLAAIGKAVAIGTNKIVIL